jgi:hypothetical protein
MASFRYFATPYPLPKLDMVAVPEFSGGAMENYGLITYRENELLYDDLLSTAARKQRVSYISKHAFSLIFHFCIMMLPKKYRSIMRPSSYCLSRDGS